jgi:uncharacterized protein
VTPPREWRDLAWLLTSPALLADDASHTELLSNSEQITSYSRRQSPNLASKPALEAWLDDLRQNPAPLLQCIAQQRSKTPVLRLGRYAERLLEFYWQHGPTHHLEAANIALRRSQPQPGSSHPQPSHTPTNPGPRDHTTLGEIDFLVRSANNQPQHWELAVKYFLCHAPTAQAQPQHFIGPDAAETLASKLQKLERQLHHQPPAPWSAEHWQPRLFSRGYMFYRWGAPAPHCAALHPHHLQAWWLPVKELPLLPHPQFALLGRAMWMAPFDAHADSALALGNAAHITQALHNQWAQAPVPGRKAPGAQLVAALDAQGQEVTRYFVKPA